MSRIVDHGTSKWKHGVELEIFMKVKASDRADRTAVARTQLDGDDPQVKSYRFLTKTTRYKSSRSIFQDQPALVENDDSRATCPSRSGSCRSSRSSPRRSRSEFKNVPGVDRSTRAAKQVKTLLNATRWIRLAFFSMAGVLLASSLFLIVNTIRLATFARRREIEVMKLVGASNWFVRVPFMAEGLVQGAIGAGLRVRARLLLEVGSSRTC